MAKKIPSILLLDLLSMPGLLMGKSRNAKWHLRHVCPRCPQERRSHRDVHGNGICWWEENWKKGNYGIPRNMGLKNFFRVHLGAETRLGHLRKQ
ncbi:MAG: hypothetical protein KJ955_00355 [Nanoarchaeota archaeon]|nr:hypothetical protein [Nanoarchaeota archaeon]